MTSEAYATNTALWQFEGRSSRFRDCNLYLHQLNRRQGAIRSQADWRPQLPPVQQSPQQKAMTEARRILQQKRQTDPSYATLPDVFGLDDQTRAHLMDVRPLGGKNAETERLAVMHGVSTSAVQVCSLCFASHLCRKQVLQMISYDARILLKSAACIIKSWMHCKLLGMLCIPSPPAC